jgi:CBS-domain-containing membrane protein
VLGNEVYDDDVPAGKLTRRDVVPVEPEESVGYAMAQMLEQEADHLPVTEGGQLVGICTRSDVIGARRSQLARERTESGWHAPGCWTLRGRPRPQPLSSEAPPAPEPPD